MSDYSIIISEHKLIDHLVQFWGLNNSDLFAKHPICNKYSCVNQFHYLTH